VETETIWEIETCRSIRVPGNSSSRCKH